MSFAGGIASVLGWKIRTGDEGHLMADVDWLRIWTTPSSSTT
jgi:hypothetical protein